ncbi:unnamed protein product, partial [Brassica oleracea]
IYIFFTYFYFYFYLFKKKLKKIIFFLFCGSAGIRNSNLVDPHPNSQL